MAQRLDPPADEAVSATTQELLALTAVHGRPPATIAMLAHQEALLGPFLTWAAAIARSGALPARDHELLALRTAHVLDSPFEWHEHAKFAEAAGLSPAEIERVAGGPEDAGWSAVERALLVATDELIATGRVEQSTYEALATHYEPGALVEIPMVVGQYAMLSLQCGFFDIPAPDV